MYRKILAVAVILFFAVIALSWAKRTIRPVTRVSVPKVVAVLELAVQQLTEFVIHGIFPVPTKTSPRRDGMNPFGIQEFDGNIVPAQVEISKYSTSIVEACVVPTVRWVASVSPEQIV